MYRCPRCHQDYLLQFEPCPGCAEQATQRQRSRRARERRVGYDPVGQIDPDEFWQVWRLFPVCPCCASPWGARDTVSLDHIIPLARGGPNTGENVQPLCLACNLWKSSYIICFDRAFPGRVTAIPQRLWSALPPVPSSPQLDLMTVALNLDPRYPHTTPSAMEAATLGLTRQVQAELAPL